MENNQTSNNQGPHYLKIDVDAYCQKQRTIIEKNLFRLPPLFNDFLEPFIGLNHLNYLYKESFHCIANGFYHAGIILMSQLLEETIREIIRINTGTNHQGTFEQLLDFASGKGEKSPKPFLIHPDLTRQLSNIKDTIRNPYTHLRYPKILQGQKAPAWKISVEAGQSKIMDSLIKEISAVKSGEKLGGEINLEQVDPTTASIFKQTIDEKKAFRLAWEIYPLYELLLEIYLDKSKYDRYIREFGSPIDRAYHE